MVDFYFKWCGFRGFRGFW